MKIEVRKVKSFKGREGNGFNADLYVTGAKHCPDGTRAAEVIDDASGGSPTP